MQVQIDGIKKVDLPDSMISFLGEAKKAKVSNNIIMGLKGYYNDPVAYRNKVESLYKNLNGIKPIDFKINNVLYLNNYLEKGIELTADKNEIKQTWMEYRLIYNEQQKEKNDMMDEEVNVDDSFILNNFDEIFDRLSTKIDGVGKYVEELNNMKNRLEDNSFNVEKRQEDLEQEKANFEKYKKEKILELDKREEEINKKALKLENLIKAFDLKVSDIIK